MIRELESLDIDKNLGIERNIQEDEVEKIIAHGGIVVLQIEGPMYGFLANVANPKIVEKIWRIKGREWVNKPVMAGERWQKPVTSVTYDRFLDWVDWQKLRLKPEDEVIKILLQSKAHLVFPVIKDKIPEHLITYHGVYPTLSMFVVEGSDLSSSLFFRLIRNLADNYPEVIAGGSSANKSGCPVFTEYQPLVNAIGSEVDLVIPGVDNISAFNYGREPFQRAMALVLPQKIEILREGIGDEQIKHGISHFNL
jgi:tRNA A37 threonylcarbamoyladenosine synthetase subunit TsaC/SUA5/YrdC